MTDVAALVWKARDSGMVPTGCELARVARVDRGRLTVLTAGGERRVRPAGLPHDGSGPDAPAVGDWVAVRGEQVVAANVDLVLVVDALIGEARLRRVERYLAVAWASGATPVVVLTKADLCPDVPAAVARVAEDAIGVQVLPVSALTGSGLEPVAALLRPGRTAAMVGPSGMGKSSLANALAGRVVADTAWRKLQAEAHRQELRADARARSLEAARLRARSRQLRDQPSRPRTGR